MRSRAKCVAALVFAVLVFSSFLSALAGLIFYRGDGCDRRALLISVSSYEDETIGDLPSGDADGRATVFNAFDHAREKVKDYQTPRIFAERCEDFAFIKEIDWDSPADHYEKGRRLQETGNFQLALEQVELAIKFNPRKSESYKNTAQDLKDLIERFGPGDDEETDGVRRALQSLESEDSDKTKGTRRALLIAVSEYADDSFVSLPAVDADVEEMRDFLSESGFSQDNIVVLTRQKPLKKSIMKKLTELAEARGPDDYMVVMLSGRGLRDDEKKDYFAPLDGEPDDWDSLVAIADVLKVLESCEARFKWLLVDACRVSAKGIAEREIGNLDEANGMLVMQSCSSGEKSCLTKDEQHSLFIHNLLNGLKGEAIDDDGRVSIQGAFNYARDKVRAKQTPRLSGQDLNDFVICEKRDWIEAAALYREGMELWQEGKLEEALDKIAAASGFDSPRREKYEESVKKLKGLIDPSDDARR